MSPQQVELALKKQRLQFRSAALRDEFAGHAAAFAPFFVAGDKVHDGWVWLRRHPEVAAVTAIVLLVTRPRSFYRWTRRGVAAWQAWRRLTAWIEAHRHVAP